MVEQVSVGDSPSAHRVAWSLWLHRLSMTEGYLVKTRRGLKGNIVLFGLARMGCERFAEISSPRRCQEPRCSKRSRFADRLGFPKIQGSVDGVDGVGTLRFTKVVG